MNGTYSLLGLIVAAVIGVLVIAGFLIVCVRKAKKDNEARSIEIARHIISECRSKNRWRWVDDHTIQFIVFILGKPPRDKMVWARVTVKRESMAVRIECAYNVSVAHLDYAEGIVAALRKDGIETDILRSAQPPSLDEVSVPWTDADIKIGT